MLGSHTSTVGSHTSVVGSYTVSNTLVVGSEYPVVNSWGEPERAPHWSVVKVYIGASRCVQSVNKKSDRKAIQVLYTYVGASLSCSF